MASPLPRIKMAATHLEIPRTCLDHSASKDTKNDPLYSGKPFNTVFKTIPRYSLSSFVCRMRHNFESNRHRNEASVGHTHHQSHHGQQYNKSSSHHSSANNSSSSSHHRKSQSLDAVTISAQIGHNPAALAAGAANKSKHTNVHKEK